MKVAKFPLQNMHLDTFKDRFVILSNSSEKIE